MATAPVPNTNESLKFLEMWNADGPWTLVAIDKDKGHIETATFHKSSNGHLRSWIDTYNGKRNVYFSVNPLTKDCNGHEHPKLDDVASMEWLHVDLDPRAGESVDAEQLRIRDTLTAPPGQIPEPSVLIFSGGGYQAFWKLREEVAVGGDAKIAEDVKHYNLELEHVFGGDKCHNLNRIMRLPGTLNIPDAGKMKKGRTVELAYVVHFKQGLEYDLSQFKKAASTRTVSKPANTLPPSSRLPQDREPMDTGGTPYHIEVIGKLQLEELDDCGLDDRLKMLALVGHCRETEGPKLKDDSRSSWLFDFLCSCCRAEVSDSVMLSIITDDSYKIGACILDKRGVHEKAVRQIERARAVTKDNLIAKYNLKHAVISNYGGKCVVAEEVDDALGSILSVQSFGDFTNRYMQHTIEIGPPDHKTKISTAKIWLANLHRRQYEGVVFAPNQEPENMYNLWKGYAYYPREGDCSLYLEHIKANICGYNQEYYDYFIGWMANMIQHPDRQGHTAIVLRGIKGTGKSFVADELGSLLGRHYMAVSNSQHIVGNFNSHLQSTILLFGDEAFFAGDKRHESVLKTLITQDTIVVEPKYMNAFSSPNYVHLILASNEQWVVPAGLDERRYFVLDVTETRKQDTTYFGAIKEQMANGGREALLHYLLNYDLKPFNVRSIPQTEALFGQQLHSLSMVEEWWYRKLEDGKLLPHHARWECEAIADQLYKDFSDSAVTQRTRVDSRTSWSQKMGALVPGLKRSTGMRDVQLYDADEYSGVVTKRRSVMCYEFPGLLACRKAFERRMGKMTWTYVDTDALPEKPVF